MSKPLCSDPQCERLVHAKGMCPTHWARARRGTEPTPCHVCGEPVMSKGARLPMHRECKATVPLWEREGRPDPSVMRAQRKAMELTKPMRVPLDQRSDLRAGFAGWRLCAVHQGTARQIKHHR